MKALVYNVSISSFAQEEYKMDACNANVIQLQVNIQENQIENKTNLGVLFHSSYQFRYKSPSFMASSVFKLPN